MGLKFDTQQSQYVHKSMHNYDVSDSTQFNISSFKNVPWFPVLAYQREIGHG